MSQAMVMQRLTGERAAYWRAEISKASRAASDWYRRNAPLGWGSEANRTLERCEKYLADALMLLESDWYNERLMRTYVEGVYVAIEGDVPKWTDPVRDTVVEVKETAKTVALPALAGAGFGLIVLGGLYLWAQTR